MKGMKRDRGTGVYQFDGLTIGAPTTDVDFGAFGGLLDLPHQGQHGRVGGTVGRLAGQAVARPDGARQPVGAGALWLWLGDGLRPGTPFLTHTGG